MSAHEPSLTDSLKRSREALDRELGASEDTGPDRGADAQRRADILRRALAAVEEALDASADTSGSEATHDAHPLLREGRYVAPLVAHIVRCQAINTSRDFTTYSDGVFQTRPADPAKAVELLDQLQTGAAQQFFDPTTEQGNRKLASRLKSEMK